MGRLAEELRTERTKSLEASRLLEDACRALRQREREAENFRLEFAAEQIAERHVVSLLKRAIDATSAVEPTSHEWLAALQADPAASATWPPTLCTFGASAEELESPRMVP